MKKIWKRLLAAGLVIALVVTMVQVIPKLNTSDTAHAEGQMEYVTRGVVDSIEQLPQSKYGVNNYYGIQRGTTERPFVVLEIVPYQELAEIGYLIGECEPIDLKKMDPQTLSDVFGTLGTLGTCKLLSFDGSNYYFSDEAEYASYVGQTGVNKGVPWDGVYGYYELVESGGAFRYTNPKIEADVSSTSEANIDFSTSEDTNISEDSGASEDLNVSDDSEEAAGSDYSEEATGNDNSEEAAENDNSEEATENDNSEEATGSDNSEETTGIVEKITFTSEEGTVDFTEVDDNTSTDGYDEPSANNDTNTNDNTNAEPPEANTTPPESDSTPEANTTPEANSTPRIIAEPTIEVAEDGNGNLVWHTINDMHMYNNSGYTDENGNWVSESTTLAQYKKLQYKGQDVVFVEDFATALKESDLREVGDRIYTKRRAEDFQVFVNDNGWEHDVPVFPGITIYNQKYVEYTNKDLFLEYSVIPGADKDQIKNYKVVVKTITPQELNAEPSWIDYADLISIAPANHAGESNYVDLWKKYSGKHSDVTYYEHNFQGERDLSWECALKIYEKVTRDDENFAGIVLDCTLYDSAPEPKTSVTVDVYNWNLEKSGQTWTINHASSNNVYKLISMLFCMDSYLFKQIYLNEENPLIKDGKITLQTGEASEYWCNESFLLAPDNAPVKPIGNFDSLESYWDSLWHTYNYSHCTSAKSYGKNWCNDHVYMYNGDSALIQGYVSMDIIKNMERYTDFAASVDDLNNVHTSDAIKYILGVTSNPNDPSYGKGMTVKVLDLEPSVGLKSDSTPNWYLKESYVRMLLPHFKGKINITHQTTAEFIGKIEDLNSTYDLIYMGLDYSGYNTKEIDLHVGNGINVKKQWPDWNDDTRDGMIYMHTGDIIYSVEASNKNNIKRSAKWLLDINQYKNNKTVSVIDSALMRFAGNDISKLKLAELQDFLNADYPIVVEQYLYDLPPKLIDPASNIYAFVNQAKAEKQISETIKDDYYIDANGNTIKVDHFVPICSTTNPKSVEIAMINKLVTNISIKPLFTEYDGTTKSATSYEIANKYYLPRSGGYPYLSFEINTDTAGYKYKIYVDLDRNSRFTEDEIMNDTAVKEGTNVLKVGANTYSQQLPSDWVGLLQYKVEVYSEANSSVRCSKVGYAAVQLKSNADRKEVKVLQIMPDAGTGYLGALDLETNETFIKYYKYLEDYAVTVKSITWDEFEAYFYYMDGNTPRSRNFRYDYTAEVKDTVNPVNLDKLQGAYGDLMSYNMFIIGFGDSYNGKILSNKYGQIDFLQYFVDQGKSILFTHDLTSFYNVNTNASGFTANTLMRDLMGMNRYGAVNYLLEPTDRNRLIAFQDANYDIYDHVSVNETHGYTYYAMKRMGYDNRTDNDNIKNNFKMLYRYMITNAEGKSIGTDVADGKTTGINGDGDLTTKTTKINEGQITVYPYKIDSELEIASTHGQYYQLSPEDPDVTVWYCLAGDSNVNAVKTSTGTTNEGTSMTYAASPNDAMNNYYIYSKGNIFYSGVGHSTVTKDMEAKLFVNTMIAAYNAAYEPPKVVITNDEAVAKGALEYDIELLQSYDFNDKGELVGESFGADKYYTVTFKPQDYNLAKNTVLTGTIQWENGEYVTEIVSVSDGKVIYADSNNEFKNLQKDKEYSLQYPLSYLSKSWSRTEADGTVVSGNSIQTINFSIWNNRMNYKNTTVLNISVQPLFPLD